MLHGNLCPDGAVMKITAADPALLQHEGPAIVFDDIHDLAARVDDPDLDCDASSVMVLRNAGPVGAPGMPEWGHLPIPAKLLASGRLRPPADLRRPHERHVVWCRRAPRGARSRGRWTACARPHRRPDSPGRRVPRRSTSSSTTASSPSAGPSGSHLSRLDVRGFRRLHCEHVLQANYGCDFDFLRGASGVVTEHVTYL